ncbi:OLC1v1038517C7 [Oldenlandia corymbosa var. corymbosa]|uniref:OLC1v1038517C7 n=1 Tax=Oldenlandia corymbosa var. corymbosa TaxID=529605 RepID=A0AAV1CZZ3_OLDCO|nr:OLC1v1038517C7 [Oldenlandia corymbosa var. corymbosa]
MATVNPFDLLGDDDTEDLSVLQQKVTVAAASKKAPSAPAAQQPSKPAAKLPSKPLPPAQAVREAKSEGARGGGRSGGRGYGRGRGGRGFDRDSANFDNKEISGGQGGSAEDAEGGRFSERRGGYGGPRGSFRGGRRGGFSNGEMADGERPRRPFERRSGTGRGNEIKREGSGRGNWGTETDELSQANEANNDGEKVPSAEKLPSGEEDTADANKDTSANESEEKEPEDKEMTLEEYEKVLEEKRKALQALKTTEERKVDAKAFESMQQIANKKANDEIFIKLVRLLWSSFRISLSAIIFLQYIV